MRPDRIKRITILSDMKDTDPLDTNEDISIELENGDIYHVVVPTPQNLYTLMDQEEQNFVPFGFPFIVVREITEDVLWEMEKELLEDNRYYLKRYSFEPPIEVLDEYEKELRVHQRELRELIDKENKDREKIKKDKQS
jgi:hypothetical protein